MRWTRRLRRASPTTVTHRCVACSISRCLLNDFAFSCWLHSRAINSTKLLSALAEPGGLSTRQILDVIHALAPSPPLGGISDSSGMLPPGLRGSRRVVGADFVEYNVAADLGSGEGADGE